MIQSPTTTAPRKATPAVDVKLIVPFVNSVRSVFQTMVKIATTVNPPRLKADPCPLYDVSGIIGFSGDVIGSVVVSLQMSAAQALVSAFAGMPIEPNSPDFTDAIGELANMIAGGAKKDLGNAASITVPSIIIGNGHKIARLSDVPCIVIPCTTAAGDFAVEVNIKQVAKSN
jgi:chemotaxis protein CheX